MRHPIFSLWRMSRVHKLTRKRSFACDACDRLVLVHSSRSGRSGIRTFIATNSSAAEAERLTAESGEYLETYEHSPDEVYTPEQKPCACVCGWAWQTRREIGRPAGTEARYK